MIKLVSVWSCCLCGRESRGIGNICPDCRKASPLISGPVCAKCGMPLISELSICLRCRGENYSFLRNVSLYEYRSVAREIFYQFKFENRREIAHWYAMEMDRLLKDRYPGLVLVPSPCSKKKKRQRGWDPVEEICGILKRKYSHPVIGCLGKRPGHDQKGLDRELRRENLKGRIYRKPGFDFPVGSSMILIDDIFTTGSTADTCSSVLLHCGASAVLSMTVAID